MHLTAEHWNTITAAERERAARELVGLLPARFSYEGLQRYSLNAVEREVAAYRYEESLFMLVPAQEATLGWDPNRGWKPNREELEDWQETAAEFGLTPSLPEYIASVTLPLREVAFRPLIVEAEPREIGWQRISEREPGVQVLLCDLGTSGGTTILGGEPGDTQWKSSRSISRRDDLGRVTRVRVSPEGEVVADCFPACTHGDLAGEMRRSGFRFPSSAEWEFLNGCGCRTLFRWGDHAPCDRYPTDAPEDGSSAWNDHELPNAFGLRFSANPYLSELVVEPGVSRGGDGGSAICGGGGYVAGWLPLATSYFDSEACAYDPQEPLWPEYVIGRRVLEL